MCYVGSMTSTIEDILDFVVNSDTIELMPSDKGILTSIDRQLKRGSALTDRQHALIKTKLVSYKNFVNTNFVDFDTALDILKYPLRSVDRSKTVTVENGHIMVKFPFSKKTIVLLDDVIEKCRRFYSHAKGTNVHQFKLNEITVEMIVDAFYNKNFFIDEEIMDHYKKVKEAKMNPNVIVPGVYNNELKNFRQPALDFIKGEIGEISPENLIKLYDRRRRYGIAHIVCEDPGDLIGNIAFRDDTEIAIDPAKYSLNDIVYAVMELDRFPLLVLVDDDKTLDNVATVYNAFKGIVPNDKQTVLFRVDTNGDYNLNNFVHDQKLNNWLDKNTQIVYINKNKLPKLLLRSEWKPMATLALSSYRCNTNVLTYVKDVCDLIMYNDKDMSIIGSKNRYGIY